MINQQLEVSNFPGSVGRSRTENSAIIYKLYIGTFVKVCQRLLEFKHLILIFRLILGHYVMASNHML